MNSHTGARVFALTVFLLVVHHSSMHVDSHTQSIAQLHKNEENFAQMRGEEVYAALRRKMRLLVVPVIKYIAREIAASINIPVDNM